MAHVTNSVCKLVSYNMHGFLQGLSATKDLIENQLIDIFCLQEHWLSPVNMIKFDQTFENYFTCGISAMESVVEIGPLRGRPFGGVAVMINNRLKPFTNIIHADQRYVIVKINNCVIVNIYLPCSGTPDRLSLIDETFCEISAHLLDVSESECNIVFCGDMNCDLDSTESVPVLVSSFLSEFNLSRCDLMHEHQKSFTYCNTLGASSCIDFILMSDIDICHNYRVIDTGSNLSDHLPIMIEFKLEVTPDESCYSSQSIGAITQEYLRWDHADLNSYYLQTGNLLQSLLRDSDSVLSSDSVSPSVAKSVINDVYVKIIEILRETASYTVPQRRKGFYKFWWTQELNELKEKSIVSHQSWKEAGKPHTGPIFSDYITNKLNYKRRIRESQENETQTYTNDLHDALLRKQGTEFWKCWKSRFDSNYKHFPCINGLKDENEILNKLVEHFQLISTNSTVSGAKLLYDKYCCKRNSYTGACYSSEFEFDVSLVERVIRDMKRGKAAGLDRLNVEHLQYCHPAVYTLLKKLFNFMLRNGCVPDDFGLSYTVPLPKTNGKLLNIGDFRGISISAVISKVFERCVLSRFERFFITHDNQFGFKRGLSCSHAIYSVNSVINLYTEAGTTVNLCAVDVKKAFDKVNHHGLFLKLMDRQVPINLLSLLENWFQASFTCVRWGGKFSRFFSLQCGVRQGGVLSPYLFAIYVDDIISKVIRMNMGCTIGLRSMAIICYADDILLLAPSVVTLQKLLSVVESELTDLDMSLNSSKSSCIRFGPRYKVPCCKIVSRNAEEINWVASYRYLGVVLTTSRHFKCDFANARKSFFRSVNSVFGKVLRTASEEVVVQLINSKCLPVLLYGLESCPVNATDMNTFDFVQTRVLMKLFRTGSVTVINECRDMFGIKLVSEMIISRKKRFLDKFLRNNQNYICMSIANVAKKELRNY